MYINIKYIYIYIKMTGSLMQLVAYGIENIYLTDNPQITFFKTVYRRYTNFSIESIPQHFNSKVNFGNKVSCTISKNGDLINRIYVVITLPNIPQLQNDAKIRWINYIGYNLLKTIELEIGGKVIDTHYTEWLYIWNELNQKENISIDKMIGNVDELIKFDSYKNAYTLYIPLHFWFCNNISLSLPLIALTNSDVKINIEIAEFDECIIVGPTHYIYITDAICLFKKYELIKINSQNEYIQYINFNNSNMLLGYIKTDNKIILYPNDILYGIESEYITSVYDPETLLYNTIKKNIEILNLSKSNTTFRNIYNLSLIDACLLVDYVYLDSIERSKFAKSNHEYLINICQYDNDKIVYNSNNKIKIGYSNTVKELIIRAQLDNINNIYYKDIFNYTTSVNKRESKSLIKKILIKLNGFSRENEYEKDFHTYIQSFQYHNKIAPLGIFLYSFSLNPFDIQPSGSCNFSKINDISIDVLLEQITYEKSVKIRVYAISSNILKIINGYAHLVFE